ncbi:hypothetical protein BOTBODRAFT_27008 [Botryobasidium botryosum FD-172 SS1]|uniref:Uncharacterized protein n=1 Tax=Botryobasidium botryosum (strain FD-172 SS1) TaxID=930990 RepID=A0A067NA45_BOTB1|nr:hypothetical protein BOTBODRAFT_27008 [Botryobasidium botryosum FD-172 SS1]
MPEASKQYAAVANIPLIKAPGLRVPKPVEMPPDIHPLPDDVTAYFVYPFSLEPHILTVESSRQSTLAAHSARRDAYLHARDEDKLRRKRDALRRIAPGFEPHSGPLVPTRIAKAPQQSAHGPLQSSNDPMANLVQQLEAMDSALTDPSGGSSSGPI